MGGRSSYRAMRLCFHGHTDRPPGSSLCAIQKVGWYAETFRRTVRIKRGSVRSKPVLLANNCIALCAQNGLHISSWLFIISAFHLLRNVFISPHPNTHAIFASARYAVYASSSSTIKPRSSNEHGETPVLKLARGKQSSYRWTQFIIISERLMRLPLINRWIFLSIE